MDNLGSIPGGGTDGIFLFATASGTALVPTQPLIQWLPGVKRPGCEADHSSPLLPRLRIRGAMPPFPQYAFKAWCLVKHRGNCILPFTSTLLALMNL
jgi:hypothetical protein